MTQKIEQVMTPAPYKADSSISLDEAASKMKLLGIRHLPVVRDGALLGVVSERDLKLSVAICKSTGVCPSLGDLCNQDVLVFDASELLAKVVGDMASAKQDCALISKKDELVGIFTTVDVCGILKRVLEKKT